MPEEFGLWAHCPKDAKVAWGARAILHRSTIDLVPDRKGARGAELPEWKEFGPKLDAAFGEVQRQTHRLYHEGELSNNVPKLLTLYDGPGLTVLGNTNASYGYLYMIAFPNDHTEQTIPVPLSDLPPKKCGVDYPLHDSLPVPKRAKFKIVDFGSVRYFGTERAAENYARGLNQGIHNVRDRVCIETVKS